MLGINMSRSSGTSTEIYSKKVGINYCYLIKADGCIMVDTGPPGSGRTIKEWIDTLPIVPEDIQLIVLTHGHADHVGSASSVKDSTGAKIALHEADKEMFESGTVVWPTAVSTWGKVARLLLRPLTPLFRFTGDKVDIVIGDDGLALEDYGIPGRVIHTPGHTPGSVSVLLDNGDAFVGCMTHNSLPFRLGPGLPIFAEDMPDLRESWRALLEQEVRMIYPAHGGPFEPENIVKVLQ
jgi:glyoxylase-like metal-dependent hydrolase (beta-lactamase superfamily II)